MLRLPHFVCGSPIAAWIPRTRHGQSISNLAPSTIMTEAAGSTQARSLLILSAERSLTVPNIVDSV